MRMGKVAAWVGLACAVLPPTAARAGPWDRPPTRIEPAVSPIRVDAVLDEPAWDAAVGRELGNELLPGNNVPAPVRTEVRMTYDEDFFYFAFRAWDPEPTAIRAHLSDRDKTFRDDTVGLIVDTFHDQRRAFEFEVNPLGVQSDYFRNEVNGGRAIEDPTWDAIWHSAGRITADGYVVEAAIPWTSLRFPRSAGDQLWGIMAFRIYQRSAVHWLSDVAIDRDNPCLLCQIDAFTGFAGVSPGHSLELTPTATWSRHDRRPAAAGPAGAGLEEEGEVESEAGVTARWGLSPSLNLNATVNPDFSHVEADAAQFEVNTRFALFYSEKRPFFLEGADYFTTPLNAVHSRTIGDPEWGLKLTGTAGRNAVGVYVAEDEATSLILPANQRSELAPVGGDSGVGVLRYRRDLGRSSVLGVLVTERQGGDYSNRVYGIDGMIHLSPADTVEVQVLESRTTYPDTVVADYRQPSGSFGGTALHLRYQHAAEKWSYWAEYQQLEPGFRADVGYLPRVDVETVEIGGKRILQQGAGGWYTRLELGLEASRSEFARGDLTDQEVALVGLWRGPQQSQLALRLARVRELWAGVLYDHERGEMSFSIQPTGALTLSLNGVVGEAIDLESAQSADLLRLGPGLTYRLGHHLDVDLSYLLERLRGRSSRLYTAEITEARLTWQFNVRTFLRAIFQHCDLDRVSTPAASAQQSLFSQLLFSYKVNPQTVFFLGYSDDHLGPSHGDLTRTERTFFAKVGYAWSW